MRASYRLRVGPAKITAWPRSLPWLLALGRRQWWLFDRGKNLAAPGDSHEAAGETDA